MPPEESGWRDSRISEINGFPDRKCSAFSVTCRNNTAVKVKMIWRILLATAEEHKGNLRFPDRKCKAFSEPVDVFCGSGEIRHQAGASRFDA